MLALKVSETREGIAYGAGRLTFSVHAGAWLKRLTVDGLPSTLRAYESRLRVHLLPAFASVPLRKITRASVRAFLIAKRESGLAPSTVNGIHATIGVILSAAKEDGLVTVNAAAGAAKRLGLGASVKARAGQIKAMTGEQLRAFLLAAQGEPVFVDLFTLMAHTGIRVGEAMGLEPGDVDIPSRRLHVRRTVTRSGGIQLPKSGAGRLVDLPEVACDALRRILVVRRGAARLFDGKGGAPLHHSRIIEAFARVVRSAGLPPHFTPHSLRHTYASRLLAEGVTPVYVQRQLGHASIQLTVDTYGQWLAMKRPRELNGLAGEASVGAGRGSKVVAISAARMKRQRKKAR